MTIYEQYVKHRRATEISLFLSLIRFNAAQMDIERKLFAVGDVDWRYIIRFAERHRVLPLLYKSVKQLGLQEQLPQDLMVYMRGGYLQIAARNIQQVQRLLGVIKLLEKWDVSAVPFKGASLAQQIYGDTSLRCYGDIDVLIKKNEAGRARDAFLSAGYCPQVAKSTTNHFRKVVRFEKAFGFLHDSRNEFVDLHWHLNNHTRHFYDYEFCEERLTSLVIGEREITCLSAEDMVLYLCVHGSSHVWGRLEMALCVAEFIDRHPNLDWSLIHELAEFMHCRKMLAIGLSLARDLFEVQLPANVELEIEKENDLDQIWKKIYGTLFQGISENNHHRQLLLDIPYHLKIQDKKADKIRYIFLRLFRPTKRDIHNFPLPSQLAIFHSFFRLIGLAKVIARETPLNMFNKRRSR